MKGHNITSFITFIALAFILPAIPGYGIPAAALFQEEEGEEADEGLSQEEYDAYVKQSEVYQSAIDEEDPAKRADMLLAFMDEYPKSQMIETHIKPAYTSLLFECNENKKYPALETISEKWLKLYPDDLQTVSYAAVAAKALQHNEKYLGYLLILYGENPRADGAYEIAELYDGQDNFDKYIEWCEKFFAFPESNVDYTTRYKIVSKYMEKQNYSKAAEYARKALEVLDVAPKPDAAGVKFMRNVRGKCYTVIAFYYFESEKYNEAIEYFEKSLKVEKFQDGFYYIGQCYWRMQNPEKAHDYLAAAEIFGGPQASKAKEQKEQLYKSLHNNTLIGMDKVHKRAQEIIEGVKDSAGESTLN